MYSKRELVAKRLFDVAASAAGVVAAAPLLVATAALVKLSSPGPVIFRQQRVGKGGKPFELWKFRTMRPATGGPLVTAGGDSRITPIGRLLRKSKLDELPELLNVLKGDLSLVGPRPEVPRYVALYPERERTFLQQIRPGITDPATVRFRNEEEMLARSSDPERTYVDEILPLKVRLYCNYLEQASFVGDLSILLQTIWVVARPTAAPRDVPIEAAR